jgi:hypothetical protein
MPDWGACVQAANRVKGLFAFHDLYLLISVTMYAMDCFGFLQGPNIIAWNQKSRDEFGDTNYVILPQGLDTGRCLKSA